MPHVKQPTGLRPKTSWDAPFSSPVWFDTLAVCLAAVLSAMQTISQSLLTAPRSHAQCTEPMVPYAWHRYGVIAGGCAPSNALLLWFPRHWRSSFTQTDEQRHQSTCDTPLCCFEKCLIYSSSLTLWLANILLHEWAIFQHVVVKASTYIGDTSYEMHRKADCGAHCESKEVCH